MMMDKEWEKLLALLGHDDGWAKVWRSCSPQTFAHRKIKECILSKKTKVCRREQTKPNHHIRIKGGHISYLLSFEKVKALFCCSFLTPLPTSLVLINLMMPIISSSTTPPSPSIMLNLTNTTICPYIYLLCVSFIFWMSPFQFFLAIVFSFTFACDLFLIEYNATLYIASLNRGLNRAERRPRWGVKKQIHQDLCQAGLLQLKIYSMGKPISTHLTYLLSSASPK